MISVKAVLVNTHFYDFKIFHNALYNVNNNNNINKY